MLAGTTNVYIFKSAFLGVRQFLATESPLKVMKNAVYFILFHLFSFSRYLSFCLEFLDKKNAVHFYKAPNEKPVFLKSSLQTHFF